MGPRKDPARRIKETPRVGVDRPQSLMSWEIKLNMNLAY